MSSRTVAPAERAAELRRLIEHHNYRYHVLDDPRSPDSAYDALFDELKALEDEAPRARHARLPDAAGRRAAGGGVPQGRAPLSDGLAGEGDDARGAREVGRRHPQATRHGRARRVRPRAEDRRLGRVARLRGGASSCVERRAATASAGRTSRPNLRTHRADPASYARRDVAACAGRGTRRDLLPARRVSTVSTRRSWPQARSRHPTPETRRRARSGS